MNQFVFQENLAFLIDEVHVLFHRMFCLAYGELRQKKREIHFFILKF